MVVVHECHHTNEINLKATLINDLKLNWYWCYLTHFPFADFPDQLLIFLISCHPGKNIFDETIVLTTETWRLYQSLWYQSLWKFQDNHSALTIIQNFCEVRSFDATWWPDLARPSEIFTTYAQKIFLTIWKKLKAGVSKVSGQTAERRFAEYHFAERISPNVILPICFLPTC